MSTSVVRTCKTTQDLEKPEHIVVTFLGNQVTHGFLTAEVRTPSSSIVQGSTVHK